MYKSGVWVTMSCSYVYAWNVNQNIKKSALLFCTQIHNKTTIDIF